MQNNFKKVTFIYKKYAPYLAKFLGPYGLHIFAYCILFTEYTYTLYTKCMHMYVCTASYKKLYPYVISKKKKQTNKQTKYF